jgi:hypothetical protein
MATMTETEIEQSFRNAMNEAARQKSLPEVGRPTLAGNVGIQYVVTDPMYGVTYVTVLTSGIISTKTFTKDRKKQITSQAFRASNAVKKLLPVWRSLSASG